MKRNHILDYDIYLVKNYCIKFMFSVWVNGLCVQFNNGIAIVGWRFKRQPGKDKAYNHG